MTSDPSPTVDNLRQDLSGEQQTISIGRVLGVLLSVTLLSAAVWLWLEAEHTSRQLDLAKSVRPIETTIDLSQVGETSIEFHQLSVAAHGEGLYLECDLPEAAKQNLIATLAQFEGEIIVKDRRGEIASTLSLNNQTAEYWEGAVRLTCLPPFAKGDYTATIRVDSGAPKLQDMTQVVYTKYELCGLESLPIGIMRCLSIGTTLLGLIAAIIFVPRVIIHGLHRPVYFYEMKDSNE